MFHVLFPQLRRLCPRMNRSIPARRASAFFIGAALFALSPAWAQNVLSVEDVSVVEGDSGAVIAQVVVSLQRPSGGGVPDQVQVQFRTENGTAQAGADYDADSGALNFGTSNNTRTVDLRVRGDLIDEPDETFSFILFQPANATIQAGADTATITILDDDPGQGQVFPVVTLDDVTVDEGDTGQQTVQVMINLSGPSTELTRFDYEFVNGTATEADGDFNAISGFTTFQAGLTFGALDVQVFGDTKVEPDETFFLRIKNPVGLTLGDTEATITIRNDDQDPGDPPDVSIGDTTVLEGDSGTVEASLQVSISRQLSAGETLTIPWKTTGGTATSGDGDFEQDNGNLTFQGNVTSQTVQVKVNGDTLAEEDEFFFVDLDVPSTATTSDNRGRVTIQDDDDPGTVPRITIDDVQVSEGDDGLTNVDVTLNVLGATTSTAGIKLTWDTEDDSATVADGDYVQGGGHARIYRWAERDRDRSDPW